MLKGYYLVYDTLNLNNPDGVEKKIISQRDMFRKNGIDMNFHILKKSGGTFWNNPEKVSDGDFIYFRRGTIVDIRFLHFFKSIKERNRKAIIFMEIPTFPYENEYEKSVRNSLALIIDHYYRKKIYKYIDRLVIVNFREECLWKIKTLNLVNGIDVRSVRKRNPKKQDKVIRICCVARFSPWHGYERLIRGLSDYYRSEPQIIVELIMVGTGVETDKYRKLTEELQLDDYVKFMGQLTGADLDIIYDNCDIGCCSLGRYKSGIDMTSELKSRELMAKGFPMICGCKIDVLEEIDYSYAIFFPNNESDIDIHNIVKWYRSIGEEVYEMSERIRRFALENIDLEITFRPIVNEALLCLS